MESKDPPSPLSGAMIWILLLMAFLLGRFFWTPSYLSMDTVNLAYSLEAFNPKLHQPQPPGYPLFVAVARAVNVFVDSPEITFWIISIVVTGASAAVLYTLGKRMMCPWTGLAAVVLFLLNPVLWFARLRSPLRPWLTLFSCLVAYCAWRCWEGDRRFVWWGAVVLGIGGGFRPDILAYMFPLWALSSWKATRSAKAVVQGGTILIALTASWCVAVAYAMGGIASAAEVVATYLADQSSKDSILLASVHTWLRPISRMLIWNGTAIAGWFWVPILTRQRMLNDNRWRFLLLWVIPGVFIQLLIHIASPGHTLFATPVWCVMGAFVIYQVGKHRETVLALAVGISAALFLNVIPPGYPPSATASSLDRAWISLKNSVAYGTFETSLERLRWWDEMTDVSINELSRLSAPDRPTMTVILHGTDIEFDFVSWRVVSYYLKDRPFWVLMDNLPPEAPGRVRLVQGMDVQTLHESSIRIPESGRVLWVMLPNGRFHRALEKIMPVHAGRYIFYTDGPYTRAFNIEGFDFISESSAMDRTK